MKNSIIILVVMLAVLSSTPVRSITIGPSTQPDWEPEAQVKLGWIFDDPNNPQDTDPLAGWDTWVGNQPSWDYNSTRVDPWGDNPAQWYIHIPNLDNDNPYKHFWLSHVYERDNTYQGPRVFTNVSWSPFGTYETIHVSEEMFDVNGIPTGNPFLAAYGRVTAIYDMSPNPQYEELWLGVTGSPADGFKLLEVYVMTQCFVAACDFDEDGNVNFGDIAVLALAWRSEPGDGEWNPDCDISDPNDDVIDYSDLAVCVDNWLADL
jgi:hypothetical protein